MGSPIGHSYRSMTMTPDEIIAAAVRNLARRATEMANPNEDDLDLIADLLGAGAVISSLAALYWAINAIVKKLTGTSITGHTIKFFNGWQIARRPPGPPGGQDPGANV